MPFYNNRCKKCAKEIEVIRNLSEHDKPPQSDEIGTEEEPKCTHEWEIIIGRVSTVKGATWGGGKGNWNSNDW